MVARPILAGLALVGPSTPHRRESSLLPAPVHLDERGGMLLREFEILHDVGRIACPTLVCTGELDPVTPVSAARELAAALPDDLVRLEIVEAAGHFTWRDEPDRYWPLLIDFVTGVADVP